MATQNNEILLAAGFLRIWQIVGDKKRGILPLIPISKSAWWDGVKTGRYPAPVKLSPRVTAWKVQDIRALIEQQ
jgi:prophage regulatory protein